MNKTQKITVALGILGAVGITYAITQLLNMPEGFDFYEDEDEDKDEF